MSGLSEKVAAEHFGRRTSMTGTQCVCGANVQPGMWSAHVAAATERAVREQIAWQLEARVTRNIGGDPYSDVARTYQHAEPDPARLAARYAHGYQED